MGRQCGGHAVNVLVVDDDKAIRESLAETLRDEGYLVETATDGADALAAIERNPPCLMLLDLTMPVMSGWQVVRHLQGQPSDLPYCVMSAAAYAAPSSAACVFSKPLNLDAPLRLVAKHCKPATTGQ